MDRRTDGQTYGWTDKSNAYCPLSYGRGITIVMINVYAITVVAKKNVNITQNSTSILWQIKLQYSHLPALRKKRFFGFPSYLREKLTNFNENFRQYSRQNDEIEKLSSTPRIVNGKELKHVWWNKVVTCMKQICCEPKVANVDAVRMSSSRLFHAARSATQSVLHCQVVVVRGTSRSPSVAERTRGCGA